MRVSGRASALIIAVTIAAAFLTAACGEANDANPPTSGRPSTTGAPSPSPATIRAGPCAETQGRTVRRSYRGQPVMVHLPACYDTSHARYPVLVLVHGAATDETQWPDVGATTDADELTAHHEIAPTILVIPSVGRLAPDPEVDTRIVEILDWVDANFRTIRDAAHRAIGGISRGGGAALRLAAARPDLFSVVGGHSPATGATPADLVERLAAYSGRIWLDVGSHDSLRRPTTELAASLRAQGTEVMFQVNPGKHDRPYWKAHTPDYLRFYAARWR